MSDPIPGWTDREGRLWLDTGYTKDGEVVIELLNGAARGTLGWVDSQFGPMEKLGGVTR
ncbi:hypothetical protein OIE13_05715 [Streptosporangium sp. NBC_01810]|uniref:hypothetical protein n=1 Tax=Streptosporangium sp. NBC_01810 TaxID=2975951 RepID=UPI002DDB39FF|nr:hypothetical protein [Streptosporangium sp. NBC_01810]WSA27369.1 hypothetical protein OIE13_05715 [Streptosporangium sp. NBC_01810]